MINSAGIQSTTVRAGKAAHPSNVSRMPFTFLLLYIIIGHLFEGHDSSSQCIPEVCLKCNNTGLPEVCDEICTTRCVNDSN
uniref:Uncharacterized protein n=1 Tax=Knipowitschia caucasica TaxID=637954 RepID=A0AAV2MIP7_KNICA